LAAHAAHGADQRDLRDHPRRGAAADRVRRLGRHDARPPRRDRREHQHLRRFPRREPHDPHVPQGRSGAGGGPMTATSVAQAVYVLAAVLFVLSLAGLSKQESARRGNVLGMVGMVLALAATIVLALGTSARPVLVTALLVAVVLLVGAAVGTWRARRVEMTQMPELIAILHSFVGAAAVLVGFNAYLTAHAGGGDDVAHLVEVALGVLVGAVTFTGSVVAFLKLSGRTRSAPLQLPGRNLLNLAALVASLGLVAWFVVAPSVWPLLLLTVVSLALGWHLVASIGGGDMPVVVSMLNSYSGWAAAAAGFMLGNDLLIVTGALVGSSGAILSYIMCRAMNRSFVSVVLGGFGAEEGAAPAGGGDVAAGEHRET